MAALEAATMEPLTAMADGRPCGFGPGMQSAIGLWIAKMAVVQEQAAGGTDLRISSEEQRRSIASGSIPNGWEMRLGAYEGPRGCSYRFGRMKALREDPARRFGLHTLRMDCLVTQVLVHDLAERPVLLEQMGGPDFAIAIPQAIPVRWPPEIALDDAGLAIVSDLPREGDY